MALSDSSFWSRRMFVSSGALIAIGTAATVLKACRSRPFNQGSDVDALPKGSAGAGATPEKRVLVVMSAANRLELQNGESIETGYFLIELGPVLRSLEAAGFAIDIATPGGLEPVIDLHGMSLAFYALPDLTRTLNATKLRQDDVDTARRWFGRPKFNFNIPWDQVDNEAVKRIPGFKEAYDRIAEWKAEDEEAGRVAKPLLSLADVSSNQALLERYAGVYFPGGHAPKVDLLSSPDVGAILQTFHFAGKPTAIVCHAPILLLTAFPGGWTPGRVPTQAEKDEFIYKGYNATIGSVVEEKVLENFFYLKGRKLKFYVAPELRRAGLEVNTIRFPTSSQVVVDRELLTGANPASTYELGTKFVRALDAFLAAAPLR